MRVNMRNVRVYLTKSVDFMATKALKTKIETDG